MNTRLFRVCVAMLFASLLLLMTTSPTVSARKGPREDDLIVKFYDTQEAAYAALSVGEIDFILYDLTSAQTDSAFTDPNIVTCRVPDSGFYQFDLNNNWTIRDYPDWRSPMSYTEMRQAVAFVSDKDYYVGTLLGGRAQRIDQTVAAPYYGWANASMSYPYYPYEYSPAGAKAVLDTTFPTGATANPYFDPTDPNSSPTIRTYPAGHLKAGQDLDPLKFKVRVEHSARRESGRRVVDWMRKLGVPINSQEATSLVLYPIVMQEFNYHFYTGGWSCGRFPPLTLYGFYHSDNAFPGGGNYVTGVRPGAPTHPKLDRLIYNASHATSFSDAVKYTKLAVGYMTEICVNVPLWSVASYWAWSRNLLGMVNAQGDDPETLYTFMNAYKIDGSPIRCGTINLPCSVNVIYGDWIYDYNVLDRMNLRGGVDIPAYNVAADQPGFFTDWETTTWDSGTKTLVRLSLRDDTYFCKPVSGDQGERVNASHLFWNAWLAYQVGDSWDSTSFRDLHHIDITSTYSYEIYFTTLSYWNTYYCQGNILPMDTWMAQGPAFINQTVETFIDPAMPGVIPLAKEPIWIDYVALNGTPLTMFIDYNIVRGDLYISSSPGLGTVEVSYRYVPHCTAFWGFTPGDIVWQVILEGAGPYYCTAFDITVGATFKRNPYYYMVTPPLGEIDFVKKSNGNYKIDIYDLAMAGGAFGSQGTGVPSRHWFPGADIAPPSGSIDIFDEVTVTGINWDQEFDPHEP